LAGFNGSLVFDRYVIETASLEKGGEQWYEKVELWDMPTESISGMGEGVPLDVWLVLRLLSGS
tara:strand:- start:257 stop:445 length:189 start_codon:yes stop_codon:yes gene_type:complete